MTGYVCKNCPLAFEVGYLVYSAYPVRIRGGRVHFVCQFCGCMHRIDHHVDEPDMLYALRVPVPSMRTFTFACGDGETHSVPQVVVDNDEWTLIRALPNSEESIRETVIPKRSQAVALNTLACSYCTKLGGLCSEEWPLDSRGHWPAFGNKCPLCQSKLEVAYLQS